MLKNIVLLLPVGTCLLLMYSSDFIFDNRQMPVDVWFVYKQTSNRNVFNPQEYSLYEGEPVKHGDGSCVMFAIKVNTDTEVFNNGSNTGKPKVDISGSDLQAQIITAINNCAEIPNRIMIQH